MSEYDRQVDAYWTTQASMAYRERRLDVITALAENEGRAEAWMFWAITASDLAAILSHYPSPDISAILPLDQFGFFAKAMANQPRPLPLVA